MIPCVDDETGATILPPFFLVQEWVPDVYDLTILEWNPDGAYLMECGTLHADERLAQHDHGRVLAFVVLEPEDWVEECVALATGEAEGGS